MEIEVKVRVDDLEALSLKARELNMELVRERHFERNTLFDYPDRSLSITGCLLRVRREEGGGLLTFKGKTVHHELYKVRPEVETTCTDAKALEEILRNIGLRPFFRYEKFRAEYRREGVLLCLDELPFGTFVEIEGGEGTIDDLAEQLGLQVSQFMKRTYADLYGEYCREHRLPFGDILFPETR